MYVLGVSCFYHDAAACLIHDGRIVAAAEEERFTRRKHDNSLPRHAIAYCLREAGITPSQLDAVAYYEKPLLKFERILASVVDGFPRSLDLFMKAMPLWLRDRLHIAASLRASLDPYDGPLYFTEHHLSHAASAFLVSPYEESAIITMDGVGEWCSASYGVGRGSTIDLTHEIRFPHSLGLLYSAFTAHLGFEVNEGEYKVMGLAPYGRPRYVDQIREIVDVKDDGSFQLDLSYFAYHYRTSAVSPRFRDLFGSPRRRDDPVEERHADIAASIQRVTEDVVLRAATHLHKMTGLSHLVMAGGVALNCVANGRIIRETPMKHLWVQPAAGDSGGSIGCAAYVYHVLAGRPRISVMDHAYLGPSFGEADIDAFLIRQGIASERLDDAELVERVARLLADDKVIGWFRGRMEFGPRALGNRSILANPTKAEMRDLVNEKIKHREQFRPFAPSVLAESVSDYFDLSTESPFMLLVAPVLEQKRSSLPAITHVDGSARIQTITDSQNPTYAALIRRFAEYTGVPVLLNTSFNVRGEPIVCTPEDAFNCFAYTEIDYLVLGNRLIGPETKRRLLPYAGRQDVHPIEGVL